MSLNGCVLPAVKRERGKERAGEDLVTKDAKRACSASFNVFLHSRSARERGLTAGGESDNGSWKTPSHSQRSQVVAARHIVGPGPLQSKAFVARTSKRCRGPVNLLPLIAR